MYFYLFSASHEINKFYLPSMLSIEKFGWIVYPTVAGCSEFSSGSANVSVVDDGARGSTLNKSSEV